MSTSSVSHTRTLLTTDKLCAEVLNVSTEWFHRRRKSLVADHGFPPPLPGFPHKYDPHAIDRWLDAQMPDHLRPAAPAEVEADNIDNLLDERAKKIAEQMAGGNGAAA